MPAAFPPAGQKQGKETKYAIRLIPLGGFVSMEGEAERSNSERSFSKVSIPKRIAIVAAGGVVNIVFAIGVFLPLQMSTGNNVTTKVDYVVAGYSAQSAGLQSGDVIKKINGKKVKIKSDIDKILSECDGNELTMQVERSGKNVEIKLTPSAETSS